jgi:hypothetical protein
MFGRSFGKTLMPKKMGVVGKAKQAWTSSDGIKETGQESNANRKATLYGLSFRSRNSKTKSKKPTSFIPRSGPKSYA